MSCFFGDAEYFGARQLVQYSLDKCGERGKRQGRGGSAGCLQWKHSGGEEASPACLRASLRRAAASRAAAGEPVRAARPQPRGQAGGRERSRPAPPGGAAAPRSPWAPTWTRSLRRAGLGLGLSLGLRAGLHRPQPRPGARCVALRTGRLPGLGRRLQGGRRRGEARRGRAWRR